jgi:hypothetical protein
VCPNKELPPKATAAARAAPPITPYNFFLVLLRAGFASGREAFSTSGFSFGLIMVSFLHKIELKIDFQRVPAGLLPGSREPLNR